MATREALFYLLLDAWRAKAFALRNFLEYGAPTPTFNERTHRAEESAAWQRLCEYRAVWIDG